MQQQKSKKRVLFVINPISGLWAKFGVEEKIEKHLDISKFDYDIVETEYEGHAIELANEAVDDGYDIVVAVGGDGSVNEIGNGLVHTQTALGIIPLGSGNGLATHLGIMPRNVAAAIKVLNEGYITEIDTVKTNMRHFFSNAGFGFDSNSARRFKHQNWRGFFSYASAMLQEYFVYYKSKDAHIEGEGFTYDGKVYMLTAFNSNQYGYNVGILPKGSMQDGQMEIIVMDNIKRYRLPTISWYFLRRKAHKLREANFYTSPWLKISAQAKRIIQLDGDTFTWNDELNMKIDPLSLKVVVPAKKEEKI